MKSVVVVAERIFLKQFLGKGQEAAESRSFIWEFVKSSSYVDDVRWRQTRVICRKKRRKPKAARKRSLLLLPRGFSQYTLHISILRLLAGERKRGRKRNKEMKFMCLCNKSRFHYNSLSLSSEKKSIFLILSRSKGNLRESFAANPAGENRACIFQIFGEEDNDII